MLKYIMFVLCLVSSPLAFAIEGSAKPLNTRIDGDIYLRLPACGDGVPLYVRNGRLVCGTVNNTARTCPANQIMVGLNPDGSLICRAVPTGCRLN